MMLTSSAPGEEGSQKLNIGPMSKGSVAGLQLAGKQDESLTKHRKHVLSMPHSYICHSQSFDHSTPYRGIQIPHAHEQRLPRHLHWGAIAPEV